MKLFVEFRKMNDTDTFGECTEFCWGMQNPNGIHSYTSITCRSRFNVSDRNCTTLEFNWYSLYSRLSQEDPDAGTTS